MTIPSGLGSQAGCKIETTYGTRVAPDRFFPILSEGVKKRQDQIWSKGIRAGRRTDHQVQVGKSWVEGPVALELGPQSTGLLLRFGFGAIQTTGAGPYTHTATPGDLGDDSMTWQFNRPDESGTDRPFDYTGCMVASWQLALKAGELAVLTLNLYGQKEDTGQTLATVSYVAGYTPFTFVQGALSVAGSAYEIDDITISGNNNLSTGRHVVTATNPGLPRQPKEGTARRSYTADINSDFWSLVAYNRAIANTDAALSLALTNGTTSLTIAGNVASTVDTPVIAGPGMLKHKLPVAFYHATSDASAITATLVNADSTP